MISKERSYNHQINHSIDQSTVEILGVVGWVEMDGYSMCACGRMSVCVFVFVCAFVSHVNRRGLSSLKP